MHPLVRITSILLLTAGSAFSQVKEIVNVHLVEVPVTVVDRDGSPVRGLTAANFELIDQGHKRPITTFDRIDFTSPESVKGTSPLNPAARRTFLLLFDLSFSSPVGRAKAQEAARNFVARGLQRRDLAAIGTIDIQHGFRLLTAFTTDRNLLTSAIGNPVNFTSSDPLQIAGTQLSDGMTQFNATTPPTDSRGAEAADILAEIARGQRRLDETYNRGQIERQINILGALARTLHIVSGRKQVIFFSEGFDPRLVQGRDARASGESFEEAGQAERGEVWKIDSDLRYGSSSALLTVDRMGRLFRGSDVVLHAVDIRGVRVQNDLEIGAKINSNEGLFLLSKPTGGDVFRNSNNLTHDLDRLLHEQEVVYVLGFHAPGSSPGKFHELKVKVNGAPASRLSYRAGYYEIGGENVLERILSNAEIVLNDIPQTEIGIASLAAPFPTAGKAQVPVIVEINGVDLIKDAPSSTLTAEIYIYAFDEDGVVRDRMFQRLTLDTTKIGERLREGGIKYYATLSLPEGKYAIKSLVRVAENERKGYARTDIVVPPASEIAVLPPFFFDEPGKWVMVKGGSHDITHAQYPFQINGEPFIPTAAPRLRYGEQRQFAVFVYNATIDEMAWETSVRDENGAYHPAASSLVKEMQAQDVTKLMFQYAPGAQDQGAAALNITIRKKGSGDSRDASVPVIVRK
jgi:VWFA-related protein